MRVKNSLISLAAFAMIFSLVQTASARGISTPWETEPNFQDLVYGAATTVDVTRVLGRPPDETVRSAQMFPVVENYYYFDDDKSGAASVFVFENGFLVGFMLKTHNNQLVDFTYMLPNKGDRQLQYTTLGGYMPYYANTPFYPGSRNMNKLFSTILALFFCFYFSIAWAESPVVHEARIAARQYMEDEAWMYAAYQWRIILENHPQDTEAAIELARALLQAGQSEEATALLHDRKRDVPPAYLVYGQALESTGELLTAETIYREGLAKFHGNAAMFERLIRLSGKLPAENQKTLRHWLEEQAKLCAVNGRAAMKKADYPQAIANYRISTLLMKDVSDKNNYALALLLTGQHSEANRQFENLKPDVRQSWQLLANMAFAALSRGKGAAAVEALEEAISHCPEPKKKALLYNNLGYVYENRSQRLKAITAYQQAMALDPSLRKAGMNLAYVYQKDGNYPGAIRIYRQMLKHRDAPPQDEAKVWNRLGFIYERLYKEKDAIHAYKQAIALAPDESEGYANLADLYYRLEKDKKTEHVYQAMMQQEARRIEARRDANRHQAALAKSPEAKARLLEFADVFVLGEAANVH